MTITNTIDPKSLQTALVSIVAEREAWETGTYAKSNQELYAVLEKCMNQYEQAKNSPALRNVVSQMLRERNIAFNSTTNTLTKIVRLVFGDCGKRAYTYARVIKVALAEKPENMSLATFIMNAGGVEEIRRRNESGVSPAQLREQRIQAATQHFVCADGVITLQTVADITPHEETENNLSLAILRRNEDGTSSVVCGIKNIPLLNAALDYVAKQNALMDDPAVALKQERARKASLSNKVRQAVAA